MWIWWYNRNHTVLEHGFSGTSIVRTAVVFFFATKITHHLYSLPCHIWKSTGEEHNYYILTLLIHIILFYKKKYASTVRENNMRLANRSARLVTYPNCTLLNLQLHGPPLVVLMSYSTSFPKADHLFGHYSWSTNKQKTATYSSSMIVCHSLY